MNTSRYRTLAYFLATTLLMAILLPLGGTEAAAQGINLEWRRWDSQIIVQPNNVLNIVETQVIRVLEGSVRRGSRYWTEVVDIQSVRVVPSGSAAPQALAENSSGDPGTYSVSRDGEFTNVQYVLPQPQSTGSEFTVQITYVGNSPTDGLVDWVVVPDDIGFPVQSSTVRIRFPEGTAPDASLVRAEPTDLEVSTSGSEITLATRSALPAGAQFVVQIPYGAGVGAAGSGAGSTDPNAGTGSGSGSGGVVPVPPTGGTDGIGGIDLGGNSTLLLICCGVGLLLLLGGGGLLNGILRSFLGGGGLGGGGLGGSRGGLGGLFGGGSSGSAPSGGLGGLFGGGSRGSSGSSGSSSSGGRGFRRSGSQQRNVGNTGGGKKKSGGGASFS